jgi:hypothetical protein
MQHVSCIAKKNIDRIRLAEQINFELLCGSGFSLQRHVQQRECCGGATKHLAAVHRPNTVFSAHRSINLGRSMVVPRHCSVLAFDIVQNRGNEIVATSFHLLNLTLHIIHDLRHSAV